MIYNLIIAAAIINIILAVLALTKGRNRLNLSFSVLSFLFAVWNICVVFQDGYSLEVFRRINTIFITYVPPAGLFFVLCLFGIEKGPLFGLLGFYMMLGAAGMIFTGMTFFLPGLLPVYMSMWFSLYIFLYEFLTLLVSLIILLYYYTKIKFKQEKIKVGYVALAFALLFAGGMLDFTSNFKIHNIHYAGNVANVIYAGIIFYAIFRLRLFDAGVFFKNFMIYTVVSVIVAACYISAAFILANQPKILAGSFLIISLLAVYYLKYLHDYISLFVGRISGVSKASEARAEFNYIKSMKINESEKIDTVLALFRLNLELDAAVYLKQGNYYVDTWDTDASGVSRVIEEQSFPQRVLVRYEARGADGVEMLDKFGAVLIMPLKYAADQAGILACKKQTADISFTQDEIELIQDMGDAVAIYIKTHTLQQKLLEEENMKRIGLMAHQMAHEIKNPLTALWGAAQLLAGKNDMENENISIIREEIQRLTGILDSWKDFSSEIKLKRESTDIVAVIADVIRLANLQGNRAEILFEKKGAEALRAEADADKLKQVLLNVIMNAAQAMGNTVNPEIRIEAAKKENFIVIKVRDNGSGIPREVMAKIKQPLFTTKPKGSGLGLAVSDRIMKAHGGNLIMESDGRTYTEVTISVPV